MKSCKTIKSMEDLPGDLYTGALTFLMVHTGEEFVPQRKFLYADLDAVNPEEIDEHLRPTIACGSHQTQVSGLVGAGRAPQGSPAGRDQPAVDLHPFKPTRVYRTSHRFSESPAR